MLKVLESKSERVAHELRVNPGRSDREIGRICGVDGKTVRAHRAKIPQIAPENSAPLQNSAADSAEAPNSALGSFGGENAQQDCPRQRSLNDRSTVVRQPLQDCQPEPLFDAANEDDPNPHLLQEQRAVKIFLNKAGDLILEQARGWPDEDNDVIVIAAPYTQVFLDKICDVLGVGG